MRNIMMIIKLSLQIKYLRVPDEIIEMVREDAIRQRQASNMGGGSGGGGGGGGNRGRKYI